MIRAFLQSLFVFCVLFLVFGGMIAAATWLMHHLFGWIFPGVESHWRLLPAAVAGIASVAITLTFLNWMNSDSIAADWEHEEDVDDENDAVIAVPLDLLKGDIYGRRGNRSSRGKRRKKR